MTPAIIDAMRAAVRSNELGAADPHQLSFAGAGTSGASVGVFQADLAHNAAARAALWPLLSRANLSSVQRVLSLLSEPCARNPLSAADTLVINGCLHSPAGRDVVDRLDDGIFTTVQQHVISAEGAAAMGGHQLTPGAYCAIACWVNMTGAPTTLSNWLAGRGLPLETDVPSPTSTLITEEDVYVYLAGTKFFKANPQHLLNLKKSVASALVSTGGPSV